MIHLAIEHPTLTWILTGLAMKALDLVHDFYDEMRRLT